MEPYEIDVSSLDKAEMVAALYNGTRNPWPTPHAVMTAAQARELIDAITSGEQGKRLYIDYLCGRPMKIHFGRPILDTRLYDRDNGPGAATRALAPLLNRPTTGLETIIAARAIIAHPGNWTCGAYARDEIGRPVDPMHPSACRYCSVGAIYKALHMSPSGASKLENDARVLLQRALTKTRVTKALIEFNDHSQHSDVLALFDCAIALATTSPHGTNPT